MRHWVRLGLIFSALGFSGCSYVPSLEEASGTTESNILIGDVVERIKCEISNSFDSVIDDPRFTWLQNWTAKVDLTLQINDQAGVTPSGSYTSYFHNAFNFGAGSTSLTSNSIASVSQFFTLNFGANYSEQALRAETISFTLSLREIKRWRAHVQTLALKGPSAIPICNTTGRELRGHLGLAEWVNSALLPRLAVSELFAGVHPSPSNAGNKPPSALFHHRRRAAAVVIPIQQAIVCRYQGRKGRPQIPAAAAVASQKAAATNSTRCANCNARHRHFPIYTRFWKIISSIFSPGMSPPWPQSKYIKTDVEGAQKEVQKVQREAHERKAKPADSMRHVEDLLNRFKPIRSKRGHLRDGCRQKDSNRSEDR